MTELFGMIKKVTEKPAKSQDSPFANVKSTRQWLESVAKAPDYDAHHALVEGFERFNADIRGDVLNRLKVLRVLESGALPYQAKIVEQYLRNQDSLKFAKQSLWRESQMFWNELATAYLDFFKVAIKGGDKEKLSPWIAEITLKTLHYTAMCIRWEYYRGQRPSGLIWRRMHKLYRLAEITGVASSKLDLGAGATSCAREYVLSLILELANPPGFKTREIVQVVTMLESIDPLPLPEIKLQRERHNHYIDMSAPMGAEKMEARWVPGKRMRYLELGKVIEAIDAIAASTSNAQESLLFRQFARVIDRGGIRREGVRTPRTGQLWAAEGLEQVLEAFAGREQDQLGLAAWTLRDESREGLGFVLQGEKSLPIGQLAAVSFQPGEDSWQLVAIRWLRHENGQTLIGAQCLTRHPKSVIVELGSSPRSSTSVKAIFMPLVDASKGMTSNLLLPLKAYAPGAEVTMRDGALSYRLRLGEIAETHEGEWVRVDFEVLARDLAAPLAA